uniref:Uncharacterized protein n=1 Tax=Rhizophora mucronata TaxID=61149 RepID=A0A2P2R1N3_RHIMU
MLSHLSQLD